MSLWGMSATHPLRDWRNKTGPFEDRDGDMWTQEKLAERVGVVGSLISQIENGGRVPSMGLAKRISAFTGISIDTLAAFERPKMEAAE